MPRAVSPFPPPCRDQKIGDRSIGCGRIEISSTHWDPPVASGEARRRRQQLACGPLILTFAVLPAARPFQIERDINPAKIEPWSPMSAWYDATGGKANLGIPPANSLLSQ